MVATQLAMRRGTSTQCEAMTPVEGEVIVDLTNDTLRVGDGSRAGGWLMPNANSLQRQGNIFAVATGTANAIEITLNPAPIAYVQGIKISFRAIANNTGAMTVNVNGLGAVSLQKISGNTISPLVAGDIVSGAIYEIVHNGTGFQLVTNYFRGLLNIGQGDLRTSIGSVTVSRSAGNTTVQNGIALPGGQYGFYPQIRRGQDWVVPNTALQGYAQIANPSFNSYLTTTFRTNIHMHVSGSASGPGSAPATSLIAQQRYITSSPPYDLGNGDVGGFIFLLQNVDGSIASTYIADAPPWAYNGPTDIRATHKCPITDKKFRTTCRKRSVQEIMDGASIEMIQEEITHDIKNADMNLIPHPFDEPKEGQRIILLDPMSDKTERLITLLNNGGGDEVSEIINGGYLKLDNSNIKRGCHKSVKACKFGYKNNG